MAHWLYRYVFRGIGIAFLVGMITILVLEISSQIRRSHAKLQPPAATGAQR